MDLHYCPRCCVVIAVAYPPQAYRCPVCGYVPSVGDAPTLPRVRP